MDWWSIGFNAVVLGIVIPAYWRMRDRMKKMHENEIAHLLEDIKEIRSDIKSLREMFINHVSNPH